MPGMGNRGRYEEALARTTSLDERVPWRRGGRRFKESLPALYAESQDMTRRSDASGCSPEPHIGYDRFSTFPGERFSKDLVNPMLLQAGLVAGGLLLASLVIRLLVRARSGSHRPSDLGTVSQSWLTHEGVGSKDRFAS